MEDFHPQKPKLIEHKPKGGLSITIFSMVMFVLAFTLLFSDQIIFILFLLAVLLIHELGHYLLMKKFNYKHVRMLFIPLMGAFVQGKKESYSQKESFLVTMAGPIPGVAVGILLLLYAANNHSAWGLQLSALFILLNVINLLPLDPLDGGQMFKLFVRKNHEFFLLVFAFLSSLMLIFIGWYINSYLLIVFGFFMGFRVRGLQKNYQMHKDLNTEEVDYRTTYKLLTNKDFYKIKQVVLDHTPSLKKFIDQVSSDESDPVLASQVNSVLITPVKRDASKLFKLFVILFWLASFAVPIYLIFTLDFTWYEL
ncbi:MAG: site-2 protease family protein [Crocinitomicaceae bacterium]